MAGLGAERAALNQPAFAVADGMFDQERVGQIPANLGEILKSELVGAVSTVPQPRFLHLRLRLMACFVGTNSPGLGLPTLFGWARPPASVRPYIERATFCQGQVGGKFAPSLTCAMCPFSLCCNAAKAGLVSAERVPG